MYVGGYVMSCLCDVIRVGGMVAGCMCCWCWRYTRTSGTQFWVVLIPTTGAALLSRGLQHIHVPLAHRRLILDW